MRMMNVTCRKSDIRRIRISCRCGNIFVAEVPQQIARALNLHPCPGCGAGFAISQSPDGKWLIERIVETVEDMAVMPAPEEKQEHFEKSYGVGCRIRIVDATKHKESIGGMRAMNPHPEHIGKFGTIIGEAYVGDGIHLTPQIKLDDGTLLTGAECWWEPVKM